MHSYINIENINLRFLIIVACLFVASSLCYEIFGKNGRIKKILFGITYATVIIYLLIVFYFIVIGVFFNK